MVAAADPVAAVRHFNRFYTRQIGLLDEGLHHSPFSLTEVRIMYEIFHRPGITATGVREALALDAGYLSRILRGLRRQGLVSARAPMADRRRRSLTLTAAIHKMTALPASRVRLTDRGRLAVGLAADVVVFDPSSVEDRATYEQPFQYPTGLDAVVVNGVVALQEGQRRGSGNGHAL